MPTRRRYVLDTNIYIDAFRQPQANVELIRFHEQAGPGEYLSSVVIQELRAGVQSTTALRRLERHVIDRYASVGRILTPSAASWSAAGDVFAALRARQGVDLWRMSKAFGNDVMLALSCREAGFVLVTDNERDFARIAEIAPFDYVMRWPDFGR